MAQDDRFDIEPYARYYITADVLDLLPIGTFLIGAGSSGGLRVPEVAMRLVKPHDASKYPAINVTPEGRLLYYFWRHIDGACKKLGQASVGKTWAWVVQPGDPGFDMLDAFKIACDHRRGKHVSCLLLYKALGIDLSEPPASL